MIRRVDHQCSYCSNVEEKWVKSLDETSTCDSCGGDTTRILSPIPTKFKGFGWAGHDHQWADRHEKEARKSKQD